ncbi:MAG: hypothetical protein QXP18_06815, partial [Sulfolobales archaeon]
TGFENLGEEVILRLDTSREEIQVVAPWRVLRKIIPGQELTVRPIDKLYMFSEDSSELLAVIEPNEYTIPL